MKNFKDIREKFNQKVPPGKKLKDFEVFLDEKDIDKAIKLIHTRFKLDKIKYNNKEIKNLRRAPSGMDVIINAIDEGDRWRLIAMGSERSKNFDKLDMRILFDSIQGLSSAKFKSMYAEGVKEATGREIVLDWDFGDPTDYHADWQDQGVYLDDWDERKMEIHISGTDKDLLKWLIDDYGMDKREAQNVIRKGKRIKI